MAHLNDEPGQHDVTVSVYIIQLAETEPKLFLHRHKVTQRMFQPGGHVEQDETIWATVCRETGEETGYTMEQLEVLQPSPRFPEFHGQNYPVPLVMRSHQYDKLDHVHDDLIFAFVTSEYPAQGLAADESQEVGFFSLDQILAMPDSDVGPDVKVLANALLKSHASWDTVPTAFFGAPPAAAQEAIQLALSDPEVREAHQRIAAHPMLFSASEDLP